MTASAESEGAVPRLTTRSSDACRKTSRQVVSCSWQATCTRPVLAQCRPPQHRRQARTRLGSPHVDSHKRLISSAGQAAPPEIIRRLNNLESAAIRGRATFAPSAQGRLSGAMPARRCRSLTGQRCAERVGVSEFCIACVRSLGTGTDRLDWSLHRRGTRKFPGHRHYRRIKACSATGSPPHGRALRRSPPPQCSSFFGSC